MTAAELLGVLDNNSLLIALIGGGTLSAVGAGLYKLGSTLGGLTRAMQGFEQRLSDVETAVQDCPAHGVQVNVPTPKPRRHS